MASENERKENMKILSFDVGTYNLVCCKRNENGDFVYKREVNAFLSMPLENDFVFNIEVALQNAGLYDEDFNLITEAS